MNKDILLGWIFIFMIFFIIMLGIYQHLSSGFESKNDKIDRIYKHLGSRLTFSELKKRCPECTNVDYYRVTNKL